MSHRINGRELERYLDVDDPSDPETGHEQIERRFDSKMGKEELKFRANAKPLPPNTHRKFPGNSVRPR